MFVKQFKIGAAGLLAAALAGGVAVMVGGGSAAVARPDAVEQEGRPGGKDKLDAAREEVRYVQLGLKREQLIAKFGEPKNMTRFESGIESLEFQTGSVRMLVEVSPEDKRVIQIYYKKKTPFTDGQVMELLNRNAEGKKWIPAKEAGTFIRSDGGMARGCGNGVLEKDAAKFGDEYQFAVLSGSEVAKIRPDVAATRKKVVEAELKELE